MSVLARPTVAEALDGAVTAIAASGSGTPRLDAEILLAWAMGTTRAGLVLDAHGELDVAAVRTFRDAVTRRAARREPVAYITGVRGFRHLELSVDPRVLVPRPETELLVEVGLELAPGSRVVDVGTGSGAIALALADERDDLVVAGTDVSPAALEVARANGRRLGLEVSWHEGDLLEGVSSPLGRVHAVLANPPYVGEAERGGLEPELAHEPEIALYAGPDGLAVARRLIVQASRRAELVLLALEVGAGQAGAVAGLMEAEGWGEVARRRDLAGHERVVVGRR